MSKKSVSIPVEVTGAPEAQRELQQTGEAVSKLGPAGEKSSKGVRAAAGSIDALRANLKAVRQAISDSGGTPDLLKLEAELMEQLGTKANKASKGMQGFDRDTKQLLQSLLAGVPGFNQLTGGLDDFIQTLGKVPTVATAVTAMLAAALFVMRQMATTTADLNRQMIEAQKRVDEALAAARAAGRDERVEIADRLVAAGLDAGLTQRVLEGSIRRQSTGMMKKHADFAAIIEAAGLAPASAEAGLLAGILARGGEVPAIPGQQDARLKLVADLMEAGGDANASEQLRRYRQQTAEVAKSRAPARQQAHLSAIDTWIAELKRENPGLSEQELAMRRRMAQSQFPRDIAENILDEHFAQQAIDAGPSSAEYDAWFRFLNRVSSLGGRGRRVNGIDVDELAGIVQAWQQQQAQKGGVAPIPLGSGPAQPIKVEIHNHNDFRRTMNVDSIWSAPRDATLDQYFNPLMDPNRAYPHP